MDVFDAVAEVVITAPTFAKTLPSDIIVAEVELTIARGHSINKRTLISISIIIIPKALA